MNDERGRIPKYKIIENDIIDKINSGLYSASDALPTETKLAEVYNCSRVTVRQALSLLSFRGFIVKTQGSGTFVAPPRTVQRTPFLKSFSEDMIDLGKKPSTVVNVFNITAPTELMANTLGIQVTDKIYYIERCRYADETPLLYEKTYMSVDHHPDISMSVLNGSKYRYAEEHGFVIDYSYQNIAPIFPPEAILEQLRLSPKQPCLRIANTTYCTNGAVFDYTELFLHPELYQLNIVKYRSGKVGDRVDPSAQPYESRREDGSENAEQSVLND